MISNKKKALLFVIFATILISFGQLFWKIGVSKIILGNFYQIILSALNFYFITGTFLYGIASIFVIFALKNGNLSLVHPLLTLSQIWTMFLAYYFLSESIGTTKIFAVSFIIIGSVLVSLDDHGDHK